MYYLHSSINIFCLLTRSIHYRIERLYSLQILPSSTSSITIILRKARYLVFHQFIIQNSSGIKQVIAEYRVFRINLDILIPVIGQLIRLGCIMVRIPETSKELKYAIFKNLFSPLTLKIHGKKINNDKNLLFDLKHSIYSPV